MATGSPRGNASMEPAHSAVIVGERLLRAVARLLGPAAEYPTTPWPRA